MTTPTPRRSRVRSLDVTEVEQTVPGDIRKLMREVYTENKEMNAHKRKHDSARKELFKKMKENKAKYYKITTDLEGATKSLEADISAGDKSYIDISRLKKLVTEAQFMEIVSATQAAVKDVAGEAILAECLIVEKGAGTESVKVGLVK